MESGERLDSAELFPLPEDFSVNDTEQPWPVAATDDINDFRPSTSSPQNSPSRRRRLLSRLTNRIFSESRGSSSRNNTTASSQPTDLETTYRLPSKRKAPASLLSGNSAQSAQEVLTTPVPDLDEPRVRAGDLFGWSLPTEKLETPEKPLATGVPTSLGARNDVDASGVASESRGLFIDWENVYPRITAPSGSSTSPKKSNETSTRADINYAKSAMLFQSEGSGAAQDPADDSGRLRYLPLIPDTHSMAMPSFTTSTHLTILQSHRLRMEGMVANSSTSQFFSPTWKPGLPVEIFELIVEYLSSDDVKSMRLVCKEFEEKVSRSVFQTSVVPFNTELYDMIDEDTRTVNRATMTNHATDVSDRLADVEMGGLQWQNATEDSEGKVYKGHGLRVFEGFGPHIKRFGMSFEVAEGQLSNPPMKKELDQIYAYHGFYNWPIQKYARFDNLEGLERTADETLRMKAAFSKLKEVRELGLSIDNGLGWLNGPDISLHGRIFQRPSPVFGLSKRTPGHRSQEAAEFWKAIMDSRPDPLDRSESTEFSLRQAFLKGTPAELPGLPARFADSKKWSSVATKTGNISSKKRDSSDEGRFGLLYTTTLHSNASESPIFDSDTLVPASLKKGQKEWLLETQWAQRAFLECYMLAVVDNREVFANVTTLKVAKISSGFLKSLARKNFWNSLPGLTDVTIHVKPDWRSVEKELGVAEISVLTPSKAVRRFYKHLLKNNIRKRTSIKKLDIGWAGGGEHAHGMFARNNNVLPAPICDLTDIAAMGAASMLVFDSVQHLTLTNCWISPVMLQNLVVDHAEKALKTLTLDSVSLTAHPYAPTGVGTVHPHPVAGATNGNHQPPWVVQWAQANIGQPGGAAAMAAALGVAATIHPPAPAPPYEHWTSNHRMGSWPELLNRLSPGPTFDDYLPTSPPWEPPHPPRLETSLQVLELKSCGYARVLNNASFDQFALDAQEPSDTPYLQSPWFRSRFNALIGTMLSTNDRFIARIVQNIPERELHAMLSAWGLVEGWSDPVQAEEPEYDGLLSGGTGRISGRITRGMDMINPS